MADGANAGPNSPLESQVQVDEENTKPVSNLVGCADKLGRHGSETRGGDNDTHETGHEHATAGVDLVVEPGTQGIVNETCIVSAMILQSSVSYSPAVVNQTALNSKGMLPVIPRPS